MTNENLEEKEDYGKLSLEMHEKYNGILNINPKVPIENKRDLSWAYTPGIAAVSLAIKDDESKFKSLTMNGKAVAVITDGSAVLGLGDIGPKAALPVMEGKSLIFKKFADINAFPIAIDSKDVDVIVETIKMIAPSFAGINLEDISAPRCFEIEERLKKELSIPVFHDDQHGTAIVVLAAIINSLRITGKEKEDVKIVISGSGAAGIAITKILVLFGFKKIILCDSKGIISKERQGLNDIKTKMLEITNNENISGALRDGLKGADIFIGVSKANLLTSKDIETMSENPIIIAMANPDPEINPSEAIKGGAKIVATGRSDYPNQVNNSLVFPGIFKGVIDIDAKEITEDMKIAAAEALANLVENPTPEKIIPGPFDEGIVKAVSEAVKNSWKKD